MGHGAIVTTQLHDPAANWVVSFPDLAAEWYNTCFGIRYACEQSCVNSTYIKHSISLKRSLDPPRTSTVLEHSYYFTDVFHVNFKIWGLNLICIDLHGKFKIAMTSCPTSSDPNMPKWSTPSPLDFAIGLFQTGQQMFYLYLFNVEFIYSISFKPFMTLN